MSRKNNFHITLRKSVFELLCQINSFKKSPNLRILLVRIIRDPARTKSQGVRDLKFSKNLPLKYENSLFIAFSYHDFKKSRGSADPADPVLARSLEMSDTFIALSTH